MSGRPGAATKSRNGCLVCKRRKVKCDEARPACQNCSRLHISCVFEPVTPTDEPFSASVSVRRRAPGRPRKNWHISTTPPEPASGTCLEPRNAATDVPSISQEGGLTPSHFLGPSGTDARVLNSTDLELLTHFSTHTAATIAASKDPDHPIGHFWAHNVAQVSLTSDHVLHFVLALAAHHKAALCGHASEHKGRFTSLAEFHHSAARARMIVMLPQVNVSNASALYIASLLMFYCLCAAGPTGKDDLFLCNLAHDSDSEAAGFQPWVPLIRGVSAIRHTMLDEVFSAPLLAPLLESEGSDRDQRPSYIEFNFPRVAWSQHLRKLSALLVSKANVPDEIRSDFKVQEERTAVLSRCLNSLEAGYKAAFGDDEDEEADVEPTDKYVFKWLYHLEDKFIDLLQRRDTMGLLLMAYYAPLLQTMVSSWSAWYLRSWPGHLLRRIREILGDDFEELMRWPQDYVGVS